MILRNNHNRTPKSGILFTDICMQDLFNPFMPTGAFNICCPRDCVSLTANVERNGGHKWVKIKLSQ